jgi:hypothetical protein
MEDVMVTRKTASKTPAAKTTRTAAKAASKPAAAATKRAAPAAPMKPRATAAAKQAAAPTQQVAPRPRARPVEAPSDEVRYRWIAYAAYLRAERRGFAPGQEIDDWLAAEAEFLAAHGLS